MPEKKYHFFWQKGSPFSQWHKSNYLLDGYSYTTAEQGMMHGKAILFGDEEIAAQILQTNDPRKIKSLGRKVRGFSEREWKKHREEIVYRNSFAKFTQNQHLRDVLLETKGLLVEASPNDAIWGIGMDEAKAKRVPESKWRGLNLLGKTLTKVREDIRSEETGEVDKQQEQANQQEQGDVMPEGTKVVYMIRHGQSEGQVATRQDRKSSTKLFDCDLTRKGRGQASEVKDNFPNNQEFDSVELVVSSPLTRALHTSLLAFPNKNIIVNYDLRELGSDMPENTPRKTKEVMKDLKRVLNQRDENLLFDTDSLRPDGWPEGFTASAAKEGTRVRDAFKWLSEERKETTIAVVCHYNVIREAVREGNSVRPENAMPIRCYLYPGGELVLA